jgi:hypothetical protein
MQLISLSHPTVLSSSPSKRTSSFSKHEKSFNTMKNLFFFCAFLDADLLTSVSDPNSFDPDQGPAFRLNTDPDPGF